LYRSFSPAVRIGTLGMKVKLIIGYLPQQISSKSLTSIAELTTSRELTL
jgi:hypothetical protein